METLGKKLKSLREEKGMTLKDVARATKIRESAIQALEHEAWDKLPPRIFVKGFIQAYVKTVGGDEAQILDLFNSVYPHEDVTISCPPFELTPLDTLGRHRRSYGWVFVLLILILVGGGGYLLITHFSRPMLPQTGEKTTHVETTVVNPTPSKPAIPQPAPTQKTENTQAVTRQSATPPLKATPESSAGKPVPLRPEKTSPASEKRAATITPLPKTEKPTPPSSTTSAKTQPAAGPSTGKDNLIITAKMETWVGLKVGGKLKKQLLLRPGERYATRVNKPVELLIGNAGGIEIVYNGKKLEHIGKPGQVVRLTLSPEKKP